MNEYTPGPWALLHGNSVTAYSGGAAEGYAIEICKVNSWRDLPVESGANARLIAAAPDLLEALRALETLFSPYASDSTQRAWIYKARAAIARGAGSE